MVAVRPSSARLPRTARNRSGITRQFWMAVIPLSVAASRVLAHVLQRPVSLRHDNVATWHHRAAFKRAVPWSALRRLYARDEQVLLQTIRCSNPPFLLTPTLPPVGLQFYDWLTRGGPNASAWAAQRAPTSAPWLIYWAAIRGFAYVGATRLGRPAATKWLLELIRSQFRGANPARPLGPQVKPRCGLGHQNGPRGVQSEP